MDDVSDIHLDANDPKSPIGLSEKDMREKLDVHAVGEKASAHGEHDTREASDAVDTLLSVRGIRKSFGSNEVLKGIDLDLRPGEVLALIGGNGSGKSTLMKIIMGIYSADEGEISIDRVKVDISNPKSALAHSIYMVPQEPMLFPNMSVRENITIGFGAPQAELNKLLAETMKDIGWELDLERKASTLSIAEQGMVEILRGLMRRSEILILDEPTSALTFDEVKSLFSVVRGLRRKNIGIIYITHRLAEVFDIATSVGILRDGVMAMRGDVKDFTREDLVRGLLPPDAAEIRRETARESVQIDYTAEPVFELSEFSGYGFADVSFSIYPGEIVGLAGIVGAGRSEMATTIYGMDKTLGGTCVVGGKDITGASTKDVIAAGLSYVPEDRFNDGLFRIRDVAENTTSSLLGGALLGNVFLNRKKEQDVSRMYVENFRTKITGLSQEVGGLSGGNQQKIVIGRAFSVKPKVVILDEPTRGIDAAARADVYSVIQELRRQGVSILLISSDMEEIIELADRAFTMHRGRINHEFKKSGITQDNLMSAAFGL